MVTPVAGDKAKVEMIYIDDRIDSYKDINTFSYKMQNAYTDFADRVKQDSPVLKELCDNLAWAMCDVNPEVVAVDGNMTDDFLNVTMKMSSTTKINIYPS